MCTAPLMRHRRDLPGRDILSFDVLPSNRRIGRHRGRPRMPAKVSGLEKHAPRRPRAVALSETALVQARPLSRHMTRLKGRQTARQARAEMGLFRVWAMG